MVEGGHEIAHHSWAHIPPAKPDAARTEEADLVRANEAIARLTGRKARGYRSPSWDLSENTIDLLIAHGFLYDFEPDGRRLLALSGAPRRRRRARPAVRLRRRRPSLIEMPISWSLDDFPHFEFVRTADHGASRLAVGPRRHAELARRVPLYEKERRLGHAHLYDAPLRDRPRLSYAGASRTWSTRLADEGAVFMTMEDAAREAQAAHGWGRGC